MGGSSMEARVGRLEQAVEYQNALLDGSEAQTREGTFAVLGLLVSYLASEGRLDYGDFSAFLRRAFEGSPEDDHVGGMIAEFEKVVDFHRLDDAGLAPTAFPLEKLLSPAERADVLDTARLACRGPARRSRPLLHD